MGCVWVLCAEPPHSCWLGFLFLDAFLSWSPRRLLGIWASHFPNSGKDQTKGPSLYFLTVSPWRRKPPGLASSSWTPRKQDCLAQHPVSFNIFKGRGWGLGGATRSPGNSWCRKRAWPKHQSLKMVENCNSGPHLECRVPQFADFIVLNFDCRWLSEERTSGEHLSMESRKRDGEGPAHFPGL